MRKRARFCIVGLLACAVPWSAPLFAGSERQEASRPDTRVAVQQPDEAAPVIKKHTNVFDPLEMQGFSVALLLGEVQGVSTPDNVPPGAKKALADLREFLPYKSYRLLDTQWIRCCADPTVSGRLRGLDEQLYAFQVSISSISGTKMTAIFSLTDAAVGVFQSGKVLHNSFGQPVAMKSIIHSNFSMDTGETVVIGTSSLKGDKALVVLLTAVPRSSITNKIKKGSVQ